MPGKLWYFWVFLKKTKNQSFFVRAWETLFFVFPGKTKKQSFLVHVWKCLVSWFSWKKQKTKKAKFLGPCMGNFGFSRKNKKTKHFQTWTKKLWFFGLSREPSRELWCQPTWLTIHKSFGPLGTPRSELCVDCRSEARSSRAPVNGHGFSAISRHEKSEVTCKSLSFF